MTGYTKLFGSIINSTIWRESKETKIVWITLLAMADRSGVVESSLPGLADAARVTLAECQAALATLMAPDPYSRTKTNEGRRIREVDGGWEVLNHAKYRAKMNEEDRRERNAAWMRNKRAQENLAKEQAAAEAKSYRKRLKQAKHEGTTLGAQQAIKEGLNDSQNLG